MFAVVPDYPKSMELNCGDVINFYTGPHQKRRRYLIREIVNENEKIKFSADPPKEHEEYSLRQESLIYPNTDATSSNDRECRICGKLDNKNDNLLFLCRHCDDNPIHTYWKWK